MVRRPVIETAKLVDVYAQEWLRMKGRDEAKPKDLMCYLIERGVFTHDRREGLPLRDILRKLDKEGKLGLIRGLRVKPTNKNRQWFIGRDETRDC